MVLSLHCYAKCHVQYCELVLRLAVATAGLIFSSGFFWYYSWKKYDFWAKWNRSLVITVVKRKEKQRQWVTSLRQFNVICITTLRSPVFHTGVACCEEMSGNICTCMTRWLDEHLAKSSPVRSKHVCYQDVTHVLIHLFALLSHSTYRGLHRQFSFTFMSTIRCPNQDVF